ncbi:MAG: AAA family ATPase [Chloroflexota bacterium]|nr:AAA family ATPase [Chloroflexota bacterium]
MYEAFYGLREKPFSILPDPDYLYLSKRHEMAYTLLQYAIESQAGFAVITGEVGCGKTTLLRHLLNEIPAEITVGMITNTHESFGQLLQWILHAFGLSYKSRNKVDLYRRLTEFFIDEYRQGRRTLLIIDEAQNLSPEIMEELRMLSNINSDKDQVLQTILVGQPELKTKLNRQDLRQFAQRVVVDFELHALEIDETEAYINYRLAHAGVVESIFEEDAIKCIHDWASGVPRKINLLCDMALVYGYASNTRRVSKELILEVIQQKSEGTVFDESDIGESNSMPNYLSEKDGKITISLDKDTIRDLFSK